MPDQNTESKPETHMRQDAVGVVVHRMVSPRVGEQIAEELGRAANIIASYYDKNRDAMPANVACALTREMHRLRTLADHVKPEPKEDDEEG